MTQLQCFSRSRLRDRVRVKKFQDQRPSPAQLVGMPHIRATIQDAGPARVAIAIGATFGFAGTGIKHNGTIHHITAVCLGPASRNGSGSSVVEEIAIAGGGEALIFPVTGRHGAIITTGDE